ncbi:hypothetical protein MSPP1_002424 [Malassezia sp. CBS 17886]|nr:hypothetical protein MSPP1_002424 [Malassezia sp. CBS 17886]
MEALAVADSGDGAHPGASVISSISSLTNTIIGAGMLALPHAFASMGWLLGGAMVALCAALTQLGLHLVKLCEGKIGSPVASFYEMTQHAMPAAVGYFNAAIALKCYGVMISYLMISGHLMPHVVESIVRVLGFSTGDAGMLPAWLFSRALWIVVFAAVLSSVCFSQSLYALRAVGYVNMVAVAYLLAILLAFACSPAARSYLPPRDTVVAVRLSMDALRAFPIFVFAYTCAQNIIPLYNELRDSTVKRASLVSAVSIGASAAVYLIVGLVGYATFGSSVDSNIIAMYPDVSLFVSIGKLSVIVLTLTSYPMQLFPCRAALLDVVHADAAPDGLDADAGERSALVDHARDARVRHHATGLWRTTTIALIVSSTVIAMAVEDLSLVLGIVGAIGSTTVSFILPSLLYWYAALRAI